MQVGDDVADLGVVHHLAEGGHGAASVLDHVLHSLVIRRSAAGQELLVKHAFERWSLCGGPSVRLMALLAIGDEELFSANLIRCERTPEPLAALFAAGEKEKGGAKEYENGRKQVPVSCLRHCTTPAAGAAGDPGRVKVQCIVPRLRAHFTPTSKLVGGPEYALRSG